MNITLEIKILFKIIVCSIEYCLQYIACIDILYWIGWHSILELKGPYRPNAIWQRDANFQFSMTFNFNIFLCFSNIRNYLSNFSYLVCISCKIFIRWRFYLFLKTENSRRVVESRSVCRNLVLSRKSSRDWHWENMSPGKICPKNSLRENLEILVLFSSKSLFQYCHLIQWAFQFLEGGRVQFSLNGVGKLSEGCKIFLVCVCVGGGGGHSNAPIPPQKICLQSALKAGF
jgi:hypothetical protein